MPKLSSIAQRLNAEMDALQKRIGLNLQRVCVVVYRDGDDSGFAKQVAAQTASGHIGDSDLVIGVRRFSDA